ncbi:hypothetical protein BO78DRAFT_150878 [Aspergillus sclerotiicarbonarius CBS 121057]|uniref:Uncharacterized protein n=1 Tax=Aspergillus sclerotiicarbonarius (strain CBS 121057 / IBT 28362) TaxID=1448318 RepID=A0A319E5D8_ASPSB|nr:hypothetical protein BO78DRAFT_150878 [Aspergillus sclerotiicarbonarius CBS 121057]
MKSIPEGTVCFAGACGVVQDLSFFDTLIPILTAALATVPPALVLSFPADRYTLKYIRRLPALPALLFPAADTCSVQRNNTRIPQPLPSSSCSAHPLSGISLLALPPFDFQRDLSATAICCLQVCLLWLVTFPCPRLLVSHPVDSSSSRDRFTPTCRTMRHWQASPHHA